jgi:hypothetical protein
MEINFGFEVTSIAGVAVTPSNGAGTKDGENKAEDSHKVDSPEETKDTVVEGEISQDGVVKEVAAKKSESEFSAMR